MVSNGNSTWKEHPGGWIFKGLVVCEEMPQKVAGNARLLQFELETILVENEGTLNNRHLIFGYDELGEDMLTPAHFALGVSL